MKNLWNPEEMTEEKLEKKGASFRKAGTRMMCIGLGGLGLLILVALIALMLGGGGFVGSALAFASRGEYAFANVFVALAYLGILVGAVGVAVYMQGLRLWALGRIAKNTKKD